MSRPPSYRERRSSQTKTSQSTHSTNVLHTHTLNTEWFQAENVHNYGSGSTAKLEKEVAELRAEMTDLKAFLEYNLHNLCSHGVGYRSVDAVKAENARQARKCKEKEARKRDKEGRKREKEAQKKEKEAQKRACTASGNGDKGKGPLSRFFDSLRSKSTAPQKPAELPGGAGNISYFRGLKSEERPYIRSNSQTGMPKI